VKIAVLLENPINVGGGFNQALNAILQLRRLVGERHTVVVYTTIHANLEHLERLKIDAAILTSEAVLVDRVIRGVSRRIGLNQGDQGKAARRIEQALLANGVDLVYFVTHSSTPNHFRKLNYITTVLDLCHRDNLEFPEVSANGQFAERDLHFATCLPRAFAIIVASRELAGKIITRYGVDYDRMVTMPFEPSPFLTDEHSIARDEVLNSHELTPGYYFYPAQFWPHKNHIRILEALVILMKRMGPQADLRVVFSGGDQGNLGWIKRKAAILGVADRVRFLGFVPAEHVRALYEGALAVVMSSYFGPTNIPPLEAWALGRPLVYSAHLSEQIGDAALMANADDAQAWADSMEKVRDPMLAGELVERGRRQLKEVELERSFAEQELLRKLEQFAQRRECWE
jgi:glycosyltransferase involved in cell wall biosynthesis